MLKKPQVKSVTEVLLHPTRLLKLQEWTSNCASWFTALAGVTGRLNELWKECIAERAWQSWSVQVEKNYLLFECRTPVRGRLTTTGWLSQRRRGSNFFSCRQQLRRVQAKLQCSLRPSLSLLQSLFFFFFLFPSSFCPPSSTGCSLVRVISLSA